MPHFNRRLNRNIAIILVFSLLSVGCGGGFSSHGPTSDFINALHAQHGFDKVGLRQLLDGVVIKDEILLKIAKPAEAMPWYKYQRIFLTEERIEAGVKFWRDNALVLEQARRRYGVPPEIITAIIGVETFYGRHTGKYRVLDALSTLAFAYPPRREFFLSELENFLLLCREQNLNPAIPLGSYAGAMGMPQFMPSSFRSYAVDFNGDNKIDLWHGKADVIASVAHYFNRHHWRPGQPIAVPMTAMDDSYKSKLNKSLKPDLRLAELESLNLKITVPLALSEKIKILELNQEQGVELWATLENFFVITRYNHSALYAMAVYQLSQSILAKQGKTYEQADNDNCNHCAMQFF